MEGEFFHPTHTIHSVDKLCASRGSKSIYTRLSAGIIVKDDRLWWTENGEWIIAGQFLKGLPSGLEKDAGWKGKREKKKKKTEERERENGWRREKKMAKEAESRREGRGGYLFGENEGILASIWSAINHFPRKRRHPSPLRNRSFSISWKLLPDFDFRGKSFCVRPTFLLSPFIPG